MIPFMDLHSPGHGLAFSVWKREGILEGNDKCANQVLLLPYSICVSEKFTSERIRRALSY